MTAFLVLGMVGCGSVSDPPPGGPSPSPISFAVPSPPPPPLGRRLVTGGNLVVLGVTTDEDVVYQDLDSDGHAVEVAPLRGGATQLLSPIAGSVMVAGKTVIVCKQPEAESILVWSRHGSIRLDARCGGLVSPDGEHLLYFSGTRNGDSADLHFTNLDGTNETTLFSARVTDDLEFAGGKFIVEGAGTISAIDPETAEVTTLVTGAKPSTLVVDAASGRLLYRTERDQLVLLEPNGAVTSIDHDPVLKAHFGADGQSIFYVTVLGAVRRWSAAQGEPLQLVDDRSEADPSTPIRLSPDEKWLAVADDNGLHGRIVSAAQQEKAVTPFDGDVSRGVFSSDSSYFLYFASWDSGAGHGTVMARPVQGGDSIWVGDRVRGSVPLVGGRLLVETASAAGGLDLSVGKPGDAGVRVASGVAGYLIGEGSDRAGQPLRHLVYSLALDPARAGLYVFDVR